MPRAQLFEQPDFLPAFDDLSPLKGARVALTGQRGMVGGILHRRLAAAGLAVSPFTHDVTDAAAVDAWVKEAAPDLIFHCAAVVPVAEVDADPLRAYAVNAMGPLLVAMAVARHAPRAWTFFPSTSHVYAPQPIGSAKALPESAPLGPATFYGVSKLAGERVVEPLAERLGLSVCVGRIFSCSHASQKRPYLVPNLLHALGELPEGQPLELTNAASVRDLLDGESVVDALLHLAQRRHRGLLNIGSGRGQSVTELAQRLAARQGRTLTVRAKGPDRSNSLVADVTALKAALGARP